MGFQLFFYLFLLFFNIEFSQYSFPELSLDNPKLQCYSINITKIQVKALTRNSTGRLEHRELPGGGRQRKEILELASEHLPEIPEGKVDADGIHRYMERI